MKRTVTIDVVSETSALRALATLLEYSTNRRFVIDSLRALADRTEEMAAEEEAAVVDPWEDHEDYPVADWRLEVANDDTRLGYVDWRRHSQEA